MQVTIVYRFAISGEYYRAYCDLPKDPHLTTRDVIDAVPNMWPMNIVEVSYNVENNRKIYAVELNQRGSSEDFLKKARKSEKWAITVQ